MIGHVRTNGCAKIGNELAKAENHAKSYTWACLDMGSTQKNDMSHRENDDNLSDWGVPYFQRDPCPGGALSM